MPEEKDAQERVARLRAEIERLKHRGDEVEVEIEDEGEEGEGGEETPSPREFIEKRMRELDQEQADECQRRQ